MYTFPGVTSTRGAAGAVSVSTQDPVIDDPRISAQNLPFVLCTDELRLHRVHRTAAHAKAR